MNKNVRKRHRRGSSTDPKENIRTVVVDRDLTNPHAGIDRAYRESKREAR